MAESKPLRIRFFYKSDVIKFRQPSTIKMCLGCRQIIQDVREHLNCEGRNK